MKSIEDKNIERLFVISFRSIRNKGVSVPFKLPKDLNFNIVSLTYSLQFKIATLARLDVPALTIRFSH